MTTKEPKSKPSKQIETVVEENPFLSLLSNDVKSSISEETNQVKELTEIVNSLKNQINILIPEVKKLQDEMEYRTEYLRKMVENRNSDPYERRRSQCPICGGNDPSCPRRHSMFA